MSPKKKKPWAENGLEDWGSYMAAKKEKLEEQFEEEAKKEFQDATSLFKGIAIFVNGYTNPCADELKRLMMAHGGIYHHYMRSRITTHIIASNLPYSKIVAYRKSQNPLPICKPEWITDSLKAQKVLDWRLYVLYSNSTVTQPQLQFTTKPIDSTVFAPTDNTEQAQNTEIPRNSNENHDIHVEHRSNDAKSNSGALSTKNSEFLSEFYNNSRLHHISTMGATFKDYVNELRAKTSGTFAGLDRLKKLPKNPNSRSSVENQSDSDDDLFESRPDEPEKTSKYPIIMHIDMDCFFVSVGLRNRPELKGLPVAVTHAKGNKRNSKPNDENMKNNDSDEDEDYGSMSEIASCSYEARKAGLKNGMFLGQALKLCPNLKTINYDFDGYKQVSYSLYDTVASYTLDIEAVSCDEMYADVTNVLAQTELTPLQFASVVREEIREKTGCPVSTGFGCNKLQARLATRKAKPDGQFYLEMNEVRDYIGSMVVRDLPGVGSSTMHQLHRMNVRTCSDLQNVALAVLQKEFGKKTGEMLHNMCRGLDNAKLNFEHVRKSVSAEVNYGIRFENANDSETFLRKLSQEVANRLQKANAKGRSVTLKLMIRAKDAPKETMKFMGHGVCDNFTKSKNLIAPVDDPIIIAKEVLSLWNQMQQVPEDVRGIGIQMSRLEFTKSRPGIANIMNFIGKAKSNETESETRNGIVETPRLATNFDVSSTSKTNEKVVAKNVSTTEAKPRGLKAFLVPKVHGASKSNEFSNSKSSEAAKTDDIDESVLAELPDDIRMEILKSRGISRISIDHHAQPSTSAAANFPKTDRPAAPLRLTDEQTKSTSQSFVHDNERIGSMENIDETVLNELPEDIRKEILGSKKMENATNTETKDASTSKSRQTRQESFFKHTKSTPRRSVKSAMPPIEDIDMDVLVELPDDIRNEIMNEYRARKQAKSGDTAANNDNLDYRENSREKPQNSEEISKNRNSRVCEDANVSFSQVDPDFLAALSEDMKTDVQMYCLAKKNEKSSKSMKLNDNAMKNRNPSKQSKKKLIATKSKTTKSTNVGKRVSNDRQGVKKNVETTKIMERTKSQENVERDDFSTSGRFLDNEFEVDREAGATVKQREEIISHHSSFAGNQAQTDEHRDMLTHLVNYLFTLPVKQVKMQIQTWISNSNDVNEIDLLSLATFLSMLPKKKRLEDLHILLKTMHRCITRTGSCVWHEAYIRTVDNVQRYMQIEYNSNLMLPRIECERRECGN